MYDSIHTGMRCGQVKLWGSTLRDYIIGDHIESLSHTDNTEITHYDIAMREGGFVHIIDNRLGSWDENQAAAYVVDVWGNEFNERDWPAQHGELTSYRTRDVPVAVIEQRMHAELAVWERILGDSVGTGDRLDWNILARIANPAHDCQICEQLRVRKAVRVRQRPGTANIAPATSGTAHPSKPAARTNARGRRLVAPSLAPSQHQAP